MKCQSQEHETAWSKSTKGADVTVSWRTGTVLSIGLAVSLGTTRAGSAERRPTAAQAAAPLGQNAPAVPPTAGPATAVAPPSSTPVAGTVTTPAAPAAEAAQGGTIHGTVAAGTAGKPGGIPLPGVAVTATNTLTGKKYATATDVDGAYAMTIPKNGRYVIRAELAGFAVSTAEIVLNGGAETVALTAKPQDFGLELASRAATEAQRQEAATGARIGASPGNGGSPGNGASLGRGLQNLSVSGGDMDVADASAGAGNNGAAMPTLGNLNDAVTGESAASGSESIAVSGQTGETNGLANFSEDEIRRRVEDGVAQARSNGTLAPGADPTDAIVSMLGGMMGGGGSSDRGGGGGHHGSHGGGGGSSGFGGSGAFRNFNPAQPHGNVFYQGGNSALNSAPWSPTLLPLTNPSAYSNRFGASIAGSPYIPGLTKPDTKQFVFINLTGQKNLNAFLPNPVRVPTALERTGDFSQSTQVINGAVAPVTIYDPTTGQPIAGNNLANARTPVSPQALALLSYYPAPNIATPDPQGYNYQTISNAGSNNVAINTRYIRTIGQSTGSPFGHGGSSSRHGGSSHTPPSLRQNINIGYNYSHAASDLRNIFLPLGGATASNGNALNAGYTIGYGRLSNNASVSWNRSSAATRNYFTDTSNDPTMTAGISVPNQTGGFADPRFYNGLPRLQITNFATLTNQTPSQTINQTISFSDFVSYRHKKHNARFGFDIRRVHADSIGGNNPLGSFSFTGYATESTADKTATAAGSARQATTGSGFADFLLGQATQTSLQAGLNKIHLRENVYDGYAQDDFRMLANLTLNYGLRYEYFGPYTEKNNRLVNLDHNADFTQVDPVQPGQTGTFGGAYPRSLVNPDYTMFAPRFGFAYRLKSNSGLLKETVVRGGYGVSYNTGQFATFARNLTFQPPFAATQTNTLLTMNNPSGCASLTLTGGFNCSSKTIQNDYAVNKNYRLGMVQLYNLNIQKTLPLGIVFNLGYNGSKGSDLDLVRAPNHTTTAVTTTNAQAFTYEDSIAGSHLNQLIVSAQKRQSKGVALGFIYQYSHSIDNASSIGGSTISTAQDDQRLDLEEGNSSFDVRHKVTGNWVLELPFGPNRKFFNKGGSMSHLLDGFSLSGNFTFASGTYFTPQYSATAAQELAGGTYTLRPDRVFSQPIKGPGQLGQFFNKAAFVAPSPTNALGGFGTASRNSIEGPGTVAATASLSRTVELGDTRSFEARVTATNVFNTVQYNQIDTTASSATFGRVLSAEPMRALLAQARYRF